MANDPVKKYLLTPEADIKQWCRTCNGWRVVWAAECESGDAVTWCSTCGQVVKRIKAAEIEAKDKVVH